MDVVVPDIGDFKDVPVIEVLVKPGDRVKKDDSIVALESDKATMEVPAPVAGVVEDVRVRVGDKVSQGSLILTLTAETNAAQPQTQASPTPQPAQAAQAPAPQAQASQTQLREVTVPDIGDFKDVPVIEVFVKPGDRIEKDASLIALESEKATMEVPAESAGVVRDVLVKTGDRVSQGTPIVRIETAASAAAQASPPAQQPPPQTGLVEPAAQTAAQPQAHVSAASAPAAPSANGNGTVHASPSIRRFARELGVNLSRVQASGPNGRITREDVQGFVKSALAAPANGNGARGMAGMNVALWPVVDFAQFGEIERKPLSRIKKISGPALHRNWVMIPHVTQNDDADVTELEALRTQLNAELAASGVKLTMLAFLIKAAVTALKRFPDFNASLDGDDLVYKRYYNIGFAADTPGGLVVPVVRDADRKGLAEIASETSHLAGKARDGKLTAQDMQGGTFTISSLGGIGGTYFTPIINAPEVAILGACRAATRPVWDGTQFVPRLILPLSLSYDHRVIDGAAAARFTSFLTTLLSDLRRALL